MSDTKNFAKIILVFFILKERFFAMHASLISNNSIFNIGITDREIHTNNFISSVLILNILSGKHIVFIVSAIPNNACRFWIYNSYITHNNQFNRYP